MKIGIHAHAYGSRGWLPAASFDRMVADISAVGFSSVELSATRPHAHPGDLNRNERFRMRCLCEQSGLEICSLCPALPNYNLASPLDNEASDVVHHYRDCLELAADLECPYLVLIPGWTVDGEDTESAKIRIHQRLESIIPRAETLGVTLILEAVNSKRVNIINTYTQALEFAKRYTAKQLGFLLDTYHSFLEGELILEVIKAYGDRLYHVHLVDASRTSRERLMPGDGEADLSAVVTHLWQIGYTGNIVVEIWGTSSQETSRKAHDSITKLCLNSQL